MSSPFVPQEDSLLTSKPALRLQLRDVRAQISSAAAASAAHKAASTLCAFVDRLIERRGVAAVALYAPVRKELDTAPVHEALRRRGIALAYPKIRAGSRLLDFYRVSDLADLIPGPMGIRQPSSPCPRVDLSTISLFVIPGLAFDRRGARLGWGQGFYDRTLAQSPHPVRVGYGHQCQLLNRVPCHVHDVYMDFVVTDAGMICASKRAQEFAP